MGPTFMKQTTITNIANELMKQPMNAVYVHTHTSRSLAFVTLCGRYMHDRKHTALYGQQVPRRYGKRIMALYEQFVNKHNKKKSSIKWMSCTMWPWSALCKRCAPPLFCYWLILCCLLVLFMDVSKRATIDPDHQRSYRDELQDAVIVHTQHHSTPSNTLKHRRSPVVRL